MATEENKMPHNGSLLKKYVNNSGKQVATFISQLGTKRCSLIDLYRTPSLRTHIWWEVGFVLNRNIFGEFAERYPIPYQTKREKELEIELADLKKELEIYKRIVEKK